MAKDAKKETKSVKEIDADIAALESKLKAKLAAKQKGVDDMLLLIARVLLRGYPSVLREAYAQFTTPAEKKKLDALGFGEFIDVAQAEFDKAKAEAKSKQPAPQPRPAPSTSTPQTAPLARPVAPSSSPAAPTQPPRQSQDPGITSR